jgi:hopanoid biosynthesis associated protein HpnK
MIERKLIVTADDFGLTEGINRGIIEACSKGIVTRASILANGDAFDHAVSLAKQNESMKVGVHLTLIEEIPINPPHKIKSLVASNGKLLKNYKAFFLRYILRRININEAYCEFEAQVQKILNSGITINHIDSHQHLHMLPGVFKITLKLAEKYKIKKIRIFQGNSTGARCFKELLLTTFTKVNSATILHSGVVCPDNFYGLKQSGRMKENDILMLINKLQLGTTEIMCHPGYIDKIYYNKYSYWDYKPEEEFKALTSGRVKEKIKNRNIQLVS